MVFIDKNSEFNNNKIFFHFIKFNKVILDEGHEILHYGFKGKYLSLKKYVNMIKSNYSFSK